jgi:septal ring factor EnvC (AmiA/AmiB activator)
MNDTPTPETACADCGSTEESYFSRIEPMGYFCPDCGHEEGKPVERQCDNQVDQMTKLAEQRDEARESLEFQRKLNVELNERAKCDLKNMTEQRDRLAEALEKVIRCHHDQPCTAIVLQQDDEIKRLREALQSLTPKS